MKSVVEYMLVEGSSIGGTFRERVAYFLSLGWQPLGGISASGAYLYQAMVKYEE